jgi:hypothetical protein
MNELTRINPEENPLNFEEKFAVATKNFAISNAEDAKESKSV